MKKLKGCFISVLFAIAISAVLSFSPGVAGAIPYLDFNMDANHPSTASISYAGGAAPLVGVDISVDSVTGVNTPLNSGFTLLFPGPQVPFPAFLNFTTGPFIGFDPTHWGFGPGGSITISIPDLALNLLEGTFDYAAVSTDGSIFKVAIAGFVDKKLVELTQVYGLPDTNYNGSFNLSFLADGILPFGFQSSAVLSGDIFNTPAPVPEPATMFLLGSGLIGLAGYGRKKLFKK